MEFLNQYMVKRVIHEDNVMMKLIVHLIQIFVKGKGVEHVILLLTLQHVQLHVSCLDVEME